MPTTGRIARTRQSGGRRRFALVSRDRCPAGASFSRLCSREKRKNLENAFFGRAGDPGARQWSARAPGSCMRPCPRTIQCAATGHRAGAEAAGWLDAAGAPRTRLEATIAYFRGLNGRPQGSPRRRATAGRPYDRWQRGMPVGATCGRPRRGRCGRSLPSFVGDSTAKLP